MNQPLRTYFAGLFCIPISLVEKRMHFRPSFPGAMKKILLLCLCLWIASGLRGLAADSASITNETPAQKDARLKWWSDARFGMFIHWGLYSIPAGVWQDRTDFGEWYLEQTHTPVSQYEKYVSQFDPTNFDATAWVRAAKAAGVKYIVITSKHHDGFGMFRSDLTDWCIKSTPFQRDPIKELADACKAEGIRFCLYYSIMDWHSPDWGLRRAWNDVAPSNSPPDMDRYVRYMDGQLKELLTRYGPIGLLWFDGQWESCWTKERGDALYQYVRSLQPDIIVNNRVSKPDSTAGGGFAKSESMGDYGTPEQTIPPSGFGPGHYWESCMTMNDHWGYNKNDHNWKSTQMLVRNLIDCASKGGNYLLNVGPTSAGNIPAPSLERLKEIGQWMDINSQAIYDTSASPFSHSLPWGRCTLKSSDNTTTLYLHVFDWPADGKLLVPGLKNKPHKAYLLADTSKHNLSSKVSKNSLVVSVPKDAASPISTTVVLEIQGALNIVKIPEPKATASNVYQNDTASWGPEFAFDGNDGTRWATDDNIKQAWVAVELLKPRTLHHVRVSEAYPGRVHRFDFQYFDDGQWKTLFGGTTIGDNFQQDFEPIKAQQFRLNILDSTFGPTINDIDLN